MHVSRLRRAFIHSAAIPPFIIFRAIHRRREMAPSIICGVGMVSVCVFVVARYPNSKHQQESETVKVHLIQQMLVAWLYPIYPIQSHLLGAGMMVPLPAFVLHICIAVEMKCVPTENI